MSGDSPQSNQWFSSQRPVMGTLFPFRDENMKISVSLFVLRECSHFKCVNVPAEELVFPYKGPVMVSCHASFPVSLAQLLNKKSGCWYLETPWGSCVDSLILDSNINFPCFIIYIAWSKHSLSAVSSLNIPTTRYRLNSHLGLAQQSRTLE